jgi:hypothetical protein
MQISSIINELESLKETIEQTKEDAAKIEGRLQVTLERLKTEFELSSIEEAEEKIVSLKEELAILDRKIEKEFLELKQEYEW